MKKKYTALAVGALLCAVGLAFWLYQILQGMVITDLRLVRKTGGVHGDL